MNQFSQKFDQLAALLTTNEWSKVGHKDLILSCLLKASGRLQIEGQKTANQNHIDQKPTALCRMNIYTLFLITIYLYLTYLTNILFQPIQCLLSTTPRKN